MSYIAKKGYTGTSKTVGNGQCVVLVKALTGAPASSLWREGSKITDLLSSGKLAEGTAIATFVNGRYLNKRHGNHAAIFVRAVPGGIEIFDQWHRHPPELRTIMFGRPASGVAQRPELYSVVE
jgi:hypothetical protein